MRPCANKRKLIAWLAVDALGARQAQELHAHLESCEGCLRYLQELSNVTEKLSAVEIRPNLQASVAFHRKVVNRLGTEGSRSAWEFMATRLRAVPWRWVLPVTSAIVMAALSLIQWRRPMPPPPSLSPASEQTAKPDPAPSIANYQRVAHGSLEKLDELLTQQGSRNPSPAPTYTASTLAHADAPD